LPRVWIRIYRLPKKLREFSVLWALGSMLGVTQSVDMITSSKKEYGRVEVAVLNTDLLPNSIDTVFIGDRLFSLPIQAEGLEANEEHNNQMEVDDGDLVLVILVLGIMVKEEMMDRKRIMQVRL
jgi:hypothetical protein